MEAVHCEEERSGRMEGVPVAKDRGKDMDDKRQQLSDDARFFLSGLPRADREKALRERTPKQLDEAGKEVRSAFTEE